MPSPDRINVQRGATTFVLVALAATACRPPAPDPAPIPAACAEPALPSGVASASSIVVTAPLTPRTALDPSNPVADIAFDRAYETLVRVDCAGRTTPGLASSWHAVDNVLTLSLRDSINFWHKPNVTAADVIASWHAAADATGNRLVRLVADSSRVLSDRTIEIRLAGISPAWLASPAFVVARRTGFGFADGTGRSILREAPRGSRSDAMSRYTLSPAPAGLAEIFTVQRGAARDLIDLGKDVLITNDPAVTAYARSRADFSDASMEWDRTWVLVVPTRREVDGNADPDSATWQAFRSSLASDLIGADARLANVPSWMRTSAVCAGPPPAREGPVRILDQVTIAYNKDEPVARRIAERLVALAGIEQGRTDVSVMKALAPVLRIPGIAAAAVGLEPDEFARALTEEREYAFVLGIPSHSAQPCADAVQPIGSLPWLVDTAGVLQETMIVPLIETRWRALVRR